MESLVGVVTAITSAITGDVVPVVVFVPSSVVEVVSSSEVVLVLSVVVVVVAASSLLQELTVKLKIMKRIISIGLTKFHNRRFKLNYLYHNS